MHDEVILEGPRACADEAKKLVVAHMANPWKSLMDRAGTEPPRGWPLRVELNVSCKVADTWYEAK